MRYAKRVRCACQVRYLVQIERGTTHAMDDRPEAHLVYNPQWAAFVFRRAWDHECLRSTIKNDASIVMIENVVRDSYTGMTRSFMVLVYIYSSRPAGLAGVSC